MASGGIPAFQMFWSSCNATKRPRRKRSAVLKRGRLKLLGRSEGPQRKKARNNEIKMQELKRRREAARLHEQQARVAMDAERKRHEAEVRAQTKLRQMGGCVAGFQWIKHAGSYRCAGVPTSFSRAGSEH